MKQTLCLLLLLIGLPSIALTQQKGIVDPKSAIVRIKSGRVFSIRKSGNGICLDTPCLHVLANAHTIYFMEKGIRVEGVKVKKSQMATGPKDEGAKPSLIAGVYSWTGNPERDIALLTLEKPLPDRFRSLPFADHNPAMNEQVTGIAYSGDVLKIYDGQITGLGVVIGTDQDPRSSAVKIERLLDLSFIISFGNSGGAVCDATGHIIGIIKGITYDKDSGGSSVATGTLAVPISTIYKFLADTDHDLWTRLFKSELLPYEISDGSSINNNNPVNPKVPDTIVAPAVPNSIVTGDAQTITPTNAERIKSYLDTPPVKDKTVDEKLFISKAKNVASANLSSMINVFATQKVDFWGDGQEKMSWSYEVAIYEDREMFKRVHPNGKIDKDTSSPPCPSYGTCPERQWRDFLYYFTTAKNLSYEGRSSVKKEIVYVFSYENNLCPVHEINTSLLIHFNWRGYVGCSSKIITDVNLNPIKIYLQYSPMSIPRIMTTEVEYSRIDFQNGSKPLWLPTKIDMSATFYNGSKHFASGTWNNYHKFYSKTKIVSFKQ
ncbi:MAG: trypsin-like peptidase domain-containing protein [Patescibacteria group bacterium]|nr:trypsin-like peptidase domain-containing protein [Patescibacteria group bacterium]MDE2015014.1 trypsin-like peptidase domain-containing protein [Patescibacteria group bacterium]MDE2226442.1 trypsin-like peptidase domain-containing protein [Patescibacteria group bacterium]